VSSPHKSFVIAIYLIDDISSIYKTKNVLISERERERERERV